MSATAGTAVVCDTTAYLPTELVERLGLNLVSLYVTLDGRQERESEIADYREFYDRLRASEQGATTSQPSVGDFIEVYEPLLAQGREVVSIHLSAEISGTYEAANQAKRRLTEEGKDGERILVFDSESAAGGMGFGVIAASNAANRGADGAETVTRARQTMDALKMWFAVDTLEYLRRGGRIGPARAWLGTTFKIKPILTFEKEIAPVERVRTRARAYERLVDYARQRHDSGADAWVVQHIQDREIADRLVADCSEIFGCEPLFTSEIGPVIGAHAGPGLVGVGSVPGSVLE